MDAIRKKNSMMNKKTYNQLFKEYNRIGHEWTTLLHDMVTELGSVRFDSPFQIPVRSSNGNIYGVHLEELAVDGGGYLKLTDTDGDVWFKESLDDSACLSVICEILEQTDYELPA